VKRPGWPQSAAGHAWLRLLLALLSAGWACHGEQRRLRESGAANQRPAPAGSSELPPGPLLRDAPTAVLMRAPELGATYAENAWAVSEGKRLYSWYNCVGCHARGGGGMGPALMDPSWIYGHEPAQIFASIAGGRPNGMPAFGSRVSEAQVWLLVAYVQSLGGGIAKAAQSARGDELSNRLDSIEQEDRRKQRPRGTP
jgi:cytochrome c oxidase cbb3-type subunit 3